MYSYIYVYNYVRVFFVRGFRVSCSPFSRPERKCPELSTAHGFRFPVDWSKRPGIHGLSNPHSCSHNSMSARPSVSLTRPPQPIRPAVTRCVLCFYGENDDIIFLRSSCLYIYMYCVYVRCGKKIDPTCSVTGRKSKRARLVRARRVKYNRYLMSGRPQKPCTQYARIVRALRCYKTGVPVVRRGVRLSLSGCPTHAMEPEAVVWRISREGTVCRQSFKRDVHSCICTAEIQGRLRRLVKRKPYVKKKYPNDRLCENRWKYYSNSVFLFLFLPVISISL